MITALLFYFMDVLFIYSVPNWLFQISLDCHWSCVCDEVAVKIQAVWGSESIRVAEHVAVLGEWPAWRGCGCSETPPTHRALCISSLGGSSVVCCGEQHFIVWHTLYDKVVNSR